MEDWLIGGLVIHAGADLWADVTVQGFFFVRANNKNKQDSKHKAAFH